jgi:hypothetical protein
VIVDRIFAQFSQAAPTCFLHGKTDFPFKCGSSLFSWQTDGIIESGLPLEWGGKVVKRESVTDLQLQQEDIGGYRLIRVRMFFEKRGPGRDF